MGEFQKRVKEVVELTKQRGKEIVEELKKEHPTDRCLGLFAYDDTVILDIVEEAKKEFPMKPDFIKERRNKKVITYEYHQLGAKKLSETIEWFEKWFGET